MKITLATLASIAGIVIAEGFLVRAYIRRHERVYWRAHTHP